MLVYIRYFSVKGLVFDHLFTIKEEKSEEVRLLEVIEVLIEEFWS
jgi:hypothetical protein